MIEVSKIYDYPVGEEQNPNQQIGNECTSTIIRRSIEDKINIQPQIMSKPEAYQQESSFPVFNKIETDDVRNGYNNNQEIHIPDLNQGTQIFDFHNASDFDAPNFEEILVNDPTIAKLDTRVTSLRSIIGRKEISQPEANQPTNYNVTLQTYPFSVSNKIERNVNIHDVRNDHSYAFSFNNNEETADLDKFDNDCKRKGIIPSNYSSLAEIINELEAS